ncbi:Sel1 domain protein repeat-containing protein [Galdieria sulphuraria]|uniref:Sel1 domain protein repeat-containing protein n=1 Tax=Galdieria sulphuraria TaxID=130081 RepID=M2XK53_GALSU|nr:Sel1 domain protein repeat-containing protein [Galdieria sulphuraria]EME30512.1 Sel1 domain protein repeat-containing protein [Galdieria sulphuraria]|eukprot:XP_005707032.1 Sel1 domain protein repeat-containing protein [Galdieria sulphuraria]
MASHHYEWSQTIHTITIMVQVPYTTSTRDISVFIDKSQVEISVGGKVVFGQHLLDSVTSQEDWIPWQLEETAKGKFLIVELEKLKDYWWNQLEYSSDIVDMSLQETITNTPVKQQETVVEDVTDEEKMEIFLQNIQSRKENKVDIGGQEEDVLGIPVTPENVQQVVETYRRGVEEKESGIAAFHLGRLYHFGICLDTNYREALQCEGGYGIEQNWEQAIQLWQMGADNGNPYAMYNLGVLYLHGNGCQQDVTRALLLLKAANSLDPSLVIPDIPVFQQSTPLNKTTRKKKKNKKLSEEERQRVYEEFRTLAKYCAWTGVGLCAIGITWKLIRHYLDNRL